MKLVKEHINEKFSEDSDPIHDMGIGIEVIIKEGIKKIFDINREDKFFFPKGRITYGTCSKGSICRIDINKNVNVSGPYYTFKVAFFSDDYVDEYDKLINKHTYTINLLEYVNFMPMLTEIPSGIDYEFIFKVNEEYYSYFKKVEGIHKNPYRI